MGKLGTEQDQRGGAKVQKMVRNRLKNRVVDRKIEPVYLRGNKPGERYKAEKDARGCTRFRLSEGWRDAAIC